MSRIQLVNGFEPVKSWAAESSSAFAAMAGAPRPRSQGDP
jgi:hypothetical protein